MKGASVRRGRQRPRVRDPDNVLAVDHKEVAGLDRVVALTRIVSLAGVAKGVNHGGVAKGGAAHNLTPRPGVQGGISDGNVGKGGAARAWECLQALIDRSDRREREHTVGVAPTLAARWHQKPGGEGGGDVTRK